MTSLHGEQSARRRPGARRGRDRRDLDLRHLRDDVAIASAAPRHRIESFMPD